MSQKEIKRMQVFDRVEQGQVTRREAAETLGISYRQCLRSFKRYGEQGVAGLVHKSRGRPSNRALPSEFRHRVLARYQERYAGFGPTLAAEKLFEDGFRLDHETLRRLLLAGGIWQRCKKRRKHRSRRERKANFGEMLQIDGSHHRWFGPGQDQNCLINMIDDATGIRLSIMAEQETTEAVMRVLWLWIKRYGVPRTIYADRKNVFVTEREPTLEEQLSGQEPLTAFGKACHKLGIEIISANSPQAKGRVERAHGVHQDRFVKELKLQQITTIETANQLLLSGFNDKLNEKFAIKPAHPQNFHRPLPGALKLKDVFCFEQTRALQNDWTVRLNNQWFQVLKTNDPLPRPKQKILVREHLDGTVSLWDEDRRLSFRRISEPKHKPTVKQNWTKDLLNTLHRRPAEDHPWRRSNALLFRQARGLL